MNFRGWMGTIPPQYIFANRRFKKVVLDPPDFNPGSWIGAGSVIIDFETNEYWLTARLRKMPPLRGYEVKIYKSLNGEDFREAVALSKDDLSKLSGLNILSIEGQQLIKDPLTGKYYFYLAVDSGPTDVGWDTLLLSSEDPSGPWKSHGIVLRRSESYDELGARDVVVGIVDGKYLALYKAQRRNLESSNLKDYIVNVALATSKDGIKWEKQGLFTVDGRKQPAYLMLYGNIFAGSLGPLFIGLARKYRVKGCGLARHFEAYTIDYRNLNLETVFSTEWIPLSPYERKDYPTHGYMNVVYDWLKNRILLYLEALDPHYTKEIGWNTQVDRLILYETPLPE